MDTEPKRRGRPQLVTHEKIAAAGLRLTLPDATVAAVASELGVGIRAIYKHTTGIAEIQRITAEAIFAGWIAPEPSGEPLEEHLMAFALSLRALASENPGIAGYLVRNSHETSPQVQAQMDAHQQQVAEAFGLPLADASFLLAAVAEHVLSVTDVANSNGGRVRDRERMKERTDLAALSAAARDERFGEAEEFFEFTTRALIVGLIALRSRG